LPGYILTARAEGKSPKTIDWVAASVGYFAAFLHRYQEPSDVRFITHLHLRAFIVELQGRPAYQDHPLTRPQGRLLSPHSIGESGCCKVDLLFLLFEPANISFSVHVLAM